MLPDPRHSLAVGQGGNYPIPNPERIAHFAAKKAILLAETKIRKSKAEELKARLAAKRRSKKFVDNFESKEHRDKISEIKCFYDTQQEQKDIKSKEARSGFSKQEQSKNEECSASESRPLSILDKQRGRLKQVSMFAIAAETMSVRAKHPEQKTKITLNKLRASVNRAGLRKLLYAWPTVQLFFRVEVSKMPWPCSPDHPELSPKDKVKVSC